MLRWCDGHQVYIWNHLFLLLRHVYIGCGSTFIRILQKKIEYITFICTAYICLGFKQKKMLFSVDGDRIRAKEKREEQSTLTFFAFFPIPLCLRDKKNCMFRFFALLEVLLSHPTQLYSIKISQLDISPIASWLVFCFGSGDESTYTQSNSVINVWTRKAIDFRASGETTRKLTVWKLEGGWVLWKIAFRVHHNIFSAFSLLYCWCST